MSLAYHEGRIEKAFLRMYRNDARCEQNGRCAYCHTPISRDEATGDHVKARRKGGTTLKANIKAACLDCNRTKGAMSESAFLRKIKNPEPGDSIFIWLAWSRRRIGLATERACNRIMKAVT